MLNAATLRRIGAVIFAGMLVSQNAAAILPVAVDNQPLPTLAPMLEKTTPAVVNIATTGRVRLQENPLLNDPFFRRFFDFPDQPRERQTQSLGSGVVIDAQQGYVLTNHHVIDKAEKIRVVLSDGRAFDADVIGTDPESDVAVIRIPAERLTAVALADSDSLRVGDFVVAIGNPFGLGQTVTSGIVSALGRSGLGIEGYEDFIQTDASINPGNSGGALVNLRGELVGINTAILAPGGGNIGIGFAIPINMAHKIMDQLVTYGKISRGRLGVTAQDLTPELAQAFGLKAQRGTVIAEVTKGSPADRAGLKVGDIIQRVNGRRIESSADVRNHIGLLRVGESVSLDIVRNGRNQHIKAVIEAPKLTYLDGGRLHPRLAGARFSNIEEGMPQYGHNIGILLTELDPRSPAARTGLKEGDIVASVNQEPVKSINDLETILGNGRGAGLLLNVQRGNGALFLLIR